jgi:aspartate aminotransferase-like enzyme
MMQHRSVEFEQIFAGIQSGLREVFGTARPVYICTSSGTGVMEAGVRNAPVGNVLSLVNGAFSERFANIASACGRAVDRYEVEWGEFHEPEKLRERMRQKRYAAVTVVHSETSTGVLNDVRALSDVAHDFGARCLIDSVSGLGGAELHFDAWGCDYVLTGSQKALALPPGLGFGVASESFLSSGGDAPGKGVYFDFEEFESFARNNQAPNTPSLSLYYTLEVQMRAIRAEGMPARWARHLALAKLTHDWVVRMREEHDLAVRILAPDGHRSPTVSTIVLPQGITSDAVVPEVGARGITIGSGYGKLRATTVRIGHMGDHTIAGVTRCLAACTDALVALKVQI